MKPQQIANAFLLSLIISLMISCGVQLSHAEQSASKQIGGYSHEILH